MRSMRLLMWRRSQLAISHRLGLHMAALSLLSPSGATSWSGTIARCFFRLSDDCSWRSSTAIFRALMRASLQLFPTKDAAALFHRFYLDFTVVRGPLERSLVALFFAFLQLGMACWCAMWSSWLVRSF